MSSHHFVKEGQEPALFILDAVSYESMASLLEWAPLVITTDRAVDQVLSWGIKVDVVFGKAPDIKLLEDQLIDQMPVRVVPYTSTNTLIQEMLGFLDSEDQPSVTILTETPSVLFALLGDQSLHQEVVLLEPGTRWFPVFKGVFEKWYPADSKLVIRRTSPGQRLETKGLIESNDLFTTSGSGLVHVCSAKPFWVGESI